MNIREIGDTAREAEALLLRIQNLMMPILCETPSADRDHAGLANAEHQMGKAIRTIRTAALDHAFEAAA